MKAQNLKKLARNGNSVSVVIEKPLLDVLGATPESFVKRTVQGNKLILEFVSPAERERIINDVIDSTIETHAETFRKLSK